LLDEKPAPCAIAPTRLIGTGVRIRVGKISVFMSHDWLNDTQQLITQSGLGKKKDSEVGK